MANDPQEFVRIETMLADKVHSAFEASVAGLADQIAHKCTAGDFTAAYALANSLDLRGLVSDFRDEFDGIAHRAYLFGINEAETKRTGRVSLPPEALQAIDHLVLMVETNAADMIREELVSTIREAELETKDALHHVTKASLEKLYGRWNETRNADAPRLLTYLQQRVSAATGHDVFDDGAMHSQTLLRDKAFDYGDTGELRERSMTSGPTGLQVRPAERDAINTGNHPLVAARPTHADQVIVGDKHSPSALQLDNSRPDSSESRLQFGKPAPEDEFLPTTGQASRMSFVSSPALVKDDLSESALAATGGLLEPSQTGARKKRKIKDDDEKKPLDDIEDNDGWSKRVLRALKSDSLYVHRPLLNGEAVRAWAKDQGFTSTLEPDDMHVTICFSRTPVVGTKPDPNPLTVEGGARELQQFGDATVLHFTSTDLANRNFELQLLGATSDFDSYKSHVTISYDGPQDIHSLSPYQGPLEFGPEQHGPIVEDWADDLEELILKAEPVLSLAEKLNAATLGTGKKLFDLSANLTTSRLVSFGFLSESSKAGHASYQINAILDEKTCPVCVFMNGKTFAVAQEYGKVLQALGTSDPDSLKSIAPWPSQSKAGLAELYAMSPEEMQTSGYGSPPFHPRCRCYLSKKGTVKETIPQGTLADQVAAIIEGLSPATAEVVEETVAEAATESDVAAEVADALGVAVPEAEEAVNITPILEPHEFVTNASNGDLAAQEAIAAAVEDIAKPKAYARAAAALANGDYDAVGQILDDAGIDINDFYETTAKKVKKDAFFDALSALLDNEDAILDPAIDAWLVQKYDDDQARDSSGRWTSGGNDDSLAPPLGKTIFVYRLGGESNSLSMRNAGNTYRVAQHLTQMADFESPSSLGAAGTMITQYKVTIPDEVGKYQRLNAGMSEEAVTQVGRTAEKVGDNVAVSYSFPHGFEAEKVASVSLKDFNAALGKKGLSDADDAGWNETDKTLREVFGGNVKKYDDDQPRDESGRWTSGGSGGGGNTGGTGRGSGGEGSGGSGKGGAYKPGVVANGPPAVDETKEAWRDGAPKTIAGLMKAANKNQNALAAVAGPAAHEVGTVFANPGVKSEARLKEKIADGRTPQMITDACRGGFTVNAPGDSDKIVAELSKHFEIGDEGWQKNGAGYFDRKLAVRFKDGQVGEVQFWPPGMFEAKEFGGGHALYEQARALPKGSPELGPLNQKMKALYAGVEAKLPPAWDGLFGKNG